MRDVKSKPPGIEAVADRGRHFGASLPRAVHQARARRVATTSSMTIDVSADQRLAPTPRRDVANVLVGAAEICLLERSPRLAMRAAWLLLRSSEVSDADLLVEPAAHR